jgi:aspartate/methionine/tyrosine aminotransferase
MTDKKNDALIPVEIVREEAKKIGIRSFDTASIRQIVRLVNALQKITGIDFIRMEMGVPGLKPADLAVEGEIEALHRGVASTYPMMEGIHEFKQEASGFIKNFVGIDISQENCIPTIGAMQGSMASIMVSNRRHEKKNKTLFIDPGFPVQKIQHKALGLEFYSFDIYEFRGEKLEQKLLSYIEKGDIATILYSNPNNPSWVCLNDEELKLIGRIATKHDIVVVEDLAYFGMDFRVDYSKPGEPPFQPTVARYTDNYLLLISCSKAFSYAGQRIAIMAISDALFVKEYSNLNNFFSSSTFGEAVLYGALYTMSAGTGHSAQYGIAKLLKAVNNGQFNFVEPIKEYGVRAQKMKEIFINHGFQIVYDKDLDKPLADGFYFTISHSNHTGGELLEKLLCLGIGAITLKITGSSREEGLRACVSQVSSEKIEILNERLKLFR